MVYTHIFMQIFTGIFDHKQHVHLYVWNTDVPDSNIVQKFFFLNKGHGQGHWPWRHHKDSL